MCNNFPLPNQIMATDEADIVKAKQQLNEFLCYKDQIDHIFKQIDLRLDKVQNLITNNIRTHSNPIGVFT